MRQKLHVRKWLSAAVGALALALAPSLASAVTTAPAQDAPQRAGRYLNLQQCLYYSASAADHFTTFVPSQDNRFLAGTNVSDTQDSAPTCGGGDGNFGLIALLSGVKPLDLRGGRYLNLHQCTYYSASAVNYFTTVVPSRDGRFLAGTDISSTPETSVRCGSGDGNYVIVPNLSSVKALDLTTGAFLNLHQCVYYSATHTDHLTTVLGGAGPFSTGTKVSSTAQTTPVCAAGTQGYDLLPILPGVKALPLT
ncbi:hypothetical protein GCM10010260_37920 [Streptomyces filipinensis]|uniref:Secreted protein n=1 Tax=Streptomyces filipinensis TaxID=66887 RepID=A0A918IC46_9ACTN|nr:hypothetical protein [Streptomyces filipinensis]GGU98167.1 hypothetical protein GCM10010260_37920 [Streptomyces filipinensis]